MSILANNSSDRELGTMANKFEDMSCAGCRYEITENNVPATREEMFTIAERCGSCKRGRISVFENNREDLYVKEE